MTNFTRRIVVAATAAALVAGLTACAAPQPASEVTTLKHGVLNYMVVPNWNPLTNSLGLNLYFIAQQSVYEPLVRLNPGTFEYEPVLAETFEIADDQRHMTLKLREDVDFTDGTHFDAETAVAAIENSEENTFAAFKELFGVELEATGEYELEITTSVAMDSDFMYNFAIIPIISPTAVLEDPAGLESSPVGTGPYILDEQVTEVSARFVRNPDYRDPERYPFDVLEFVVLDDPIAASNALKSGQINATAVGDPALAGDLENNGFTIHQGGGEINALQWIDTAGTVEPALQDVRVRQAIAFAIDRKAIGEAVAYGFADDSTQLLGSGSPYYIDGADHDYDYDLDRARELMAEAGYADGFDLTMATFAPIATYNAVLIQAFADIGITLTFEEYPDLGAWAVANGSGQYPIAVSGGADLFVLGGLRGNASTIEAYGLTEEFDAIDNGTPEEAAEAMQVIGKTVNDEAYYITILHEAEVWATIPEIDIEMPITGWPPVLDAYQPVG